jgi:hypothetical protein
MSAQPENRLRQALTAGSLTEAAVIAALAVWFGVTLVSQHPNRMFDRLRTLDRFGIVIPNWRFFAPEPAQHDMHVVYRVLTADGGQTAWSEGNSIRERSWVQAVWFPERRRDKAVFDISAELLPLLGAPGADVTAMPAYRVLREFIEAAVRREHAEAPLPKGFQFALVRGGGYDEAGDPEYLLFSPFHPLKDAAQDEGQ